MGDVLESVPVPDTVPPEARPSAPERRLLHASAVDRLRDMIVQGVLGAGAKLNERALSEQLGLSRTPLREALKVLSTEGLVALQPNRGAVVATLTEHMVREIFAVMGALEALAGELACRNMTADQFNEIRALHYQMLAHHARGELAPYFRCNQEIHLAIVAASGNATLAATYRSLNAHVRRARYMANLSPERWGQAVAEHEKILDALGRRDAAQLQDLLKNHLGSKLTVVLAALDAPADNAKENADAAYD
jgi:DNA-binding GntR family transcriptional regulator